MWSSTQKSCWSPTPRMIRGAVGLMLAAGQPSLSTSGRQRIRSSVCARRAGPLRRAGPDNDRAPSPQHVSTTLLCAMIGGCTSEYGFFTRWNSTEVLCLQSSALARYFRSFYWAVITMVTMLTWKVQHLVLTLQLIIKVEVGDIVMDLTRHKLTTWGSVDL